MTCPLDHKGFPGSSADKTVHLQRRRPGLIPGSGRSAWEGIGYPLQYSWASLVAQMVKNPPAMRETQIWSPGLGRSPGGGHGNPFQYSFLENPMDREAWWAPVHGGHKESDTTEQLGTAHHTIDHRNLACHDISYNIIYTSVLMILYKLDLLNRK